VSTDILKQNIINLDNMKKLLTSRSLCLFAAVFYFAFSVHAFSAGGIKSGALMVGAAKVCINPPDNMFPAKGEYQDFIGIHDSLFVRAIVMDNGSVTSALISMDMSGVPEGEFSGSVAAALGIQPEHLFVCATHTHSGMRLARNDNASEYYNMIKNATIKALKDASSKMQPARVGYATGKAYVNTNRDQKLGEGYHMGYVPEGPSDKTVAVLSFVSLSGEPIAIYANYPVHAVVMYRAKTKDGHPEVSADLPGATARYVEAHFKDAVALWTSGAAGDQNPLFMANYNQDGPDVYDEGAAGYAILDVQARRLGEEIVRVTKSIRNTSSSVQIWGKKSSVTCPGRKRKYPPDPSVPRQGYLAPAKIDMIEGDPVTIPLHLLMINDIALAGVSAEVFAEIGIHLKEQSLFDRTLMVTHLPDKVGYIPTDKAFLLPSEKAIVNSLAPGCAEPSMISAFTQMMDEYITLRNSLK
jgi:hypothetical protein